VTEIFGSFLAFGVLHMRGVLGWGGWRWLFLIEGSLTLLIGLASFFKMPASAVETKTWFRPKGWFSDREVGIVVNRVLRDDPSKGTEPILAILYGHILICRRHAQSPSDHPLPTLERTERLRPVANLPPRPVGLHAHGPHQNIHNPNAERRGL
jgi:hypothetical protein